MGGEIIIKMSELSRDVIKRISEEHLKKNNGLIIGQCLTAVGWVGHTVPELTEQDGLVELSMADVAGGGIAVGAALAGRRPIYVVRYQGFQWFNAPAILNYAAKSKEMWSVPCPVFVRSIAMDGGIGPVASGTHHGIAMRMPGIRIYAPMTPREYRFVWNDYMRHDDPVYCSEHRWSFPIDYEMDDVVENNADVTLVAISAGRLAAVAAHEELKKENIKCNIIHFFQLKPFDDTNVCWFRIKTALENSRYGGLVIS